VYRLGYGPHALIVPFLPERMGKKQRKKRVLLRAVRYGRRIYETCHLCSSDPQ
jgi:hypothetical protein